MSPSSQFAQSQISKAIFRGRAITAWRKPELTGIYTLTFRELKNAGKSLLLGKAIPEILSCPKWFYVPLMRLYH